MCVCVYVYAICAWQVARPNEWCHKEVWPEVALKFKTTTTGQDSFFSH
jgi:hypothetical protein